MAAFIEFQYQERIQNVMTHSEGIEGSWLLTIFFMKKLHDVWVCRIFSESVVTKHNCILIM